MFIQEKQRCPKCGKFISNRLERHLCGYDAPISKDVAAVMLLPLDFYSRNSTPVNKPVTANTHKIEARAKNSVLEISNDKPEASKPQTTKTQL